MDTTVNTPWNYCKHAMELLCRLVEGKRLEIFGTRRMEPATDEILLSITHHPSVIMLIAFIVLMIEIPHFRKLIPNILPDKNIFDVTREEVIQRPRLGHIHTDPKCMRT